MLNFNRDIISIKTVGDIILPAAKEKTKTSTESTKEINTVAVILNKNKIQSSSDFNSKLEDVVKDYISIVPIKNRKNLETNKIAELFQSAFERYAKVTDAQNDMLGISCPNYVKSHLDEKKLLDLLNKYKNLPYKNKKSKTKNEINRFEDNYDKLIISEMKMEVLSSDLKNRIQSKKTVYVKNLVIGAGDAATEYWLDIHKGAHGETKNLMAKDTEALPEVVMLAKDMGSWKHDYTLAQTYSLLERGEVPSNPQAYTTTQNYEQNRHVNARFLYQSNYVNLSETEAPVILDTKVINVEKRQDHASDWEVPEALCRAKVQMKTNEETIKSDVQIEQPIKNLYKNLFGVDLPQKDYDAFLSALLHLIKKDTGQLPSEEIVKKISSEDIIHLAKAKDELTHIKSTLGLPNDYSQVDFAKNLQIFLADLAKHALKEAEKQLKQPLTGKSNVAYETLKAAVDDTNTPIISGGKAILTKEILIDKLIYADKLNVCAGFGEARVLSNSQAEKSTFERLSRFDHNLGYTPLIDGNTFMLTSREENFVKKNIIIYGGGGNATACYRKSFFREDTHLEERTYSKDTQFAENLTWVSLDGFELAGYGKLAKSALNFAHDQEQLCCGNLAKVEEGQHGTVIAYFKDSEGTYEKKPVLPSTELQKNHPLIEIDDPGKPGSKIFVRKFECDQFVYTIGQEGKPVKDMFKEFQKDLQVFKDDQSQMPLGVKSPDNEVFFWGAAAIAVGPSAQFSTAQRASDTQKQKTEMQARQALAEQAEQLAQTDEQKAQAGYAKTKAELLKFSTEEYASREDKNVQKSAKKQEDWASTFFENLRDWIVVQRIARDAEWPGVMPPSRVSSRQAEFIKRNELAQMAPDLEREVEKLKNQVKANKTEIEMLTKLHEQARAKKDVPLADDLSIKLQNAKITRTSAVETLSRAKAKLREAKSEFSAVNINLDDIEYINGFLIKAGVDDTARRVLFLKGILEARQKAYEDSSFPGITTHTLEALIKDRRIGDKVQIQGHVTLVKKS
jgi:hypothetical protein